MPSLDERVERQIRLGLTIMGAGGLFFFGNFSTTVRIGAPGRARKASATRELTVEVTFQT